MTTILATRFKNRRLELKMSQSEVAEGICKQAQISKIEQGNYSPGAELLYELSRRLNVSLDYFFDVNIQESSQNLEEFKEIATKFLSQRNYKELKYIYDLEMSKNNKLAVSDKIYLKWVEAILDYEYLQEPNKAIGKMEKIYSQITEKDEMHLRVTTSLFNFYNKNDKEKYEKLHKNINSVISNLKIITLEQLELVINFKYNYSRHLWMKKDITNAIDEVTGLIDLCKKYRSNYSLADAYSLLGNIFEELDEIEPAIKYFKDAHYIYSLENNTKMILKVKECINNLIQR